MIGLTLNPDMLAETGIGTKMTRLTLSGTPASRLRHRVSPSENRHLSAALRTTAKTCNGRS
jgi:hypothetical protein